jgi:hypothetical protein
MTPKQEPPPIEPGEPAAPPATAPRRRWPGNERVEVIVGIAIGLMIIIVWVWTCRG